MYLQINRSSDKTLTQQVYEGIKANILTGILKAHTKLPSTRQLAKELHISRNVILEAYESLFAEGYLEASKGSGTYVTEGLLLENYALGTETPKEPLLGLLHEPNKSIIDFRTGVPSLSLFPKEKWGRLYKEICESLPAFSLDYHEPRGCYALRYELCSYLRRTRGVTCSPHEMIITTGAAQAFNLITQYFTKINPDVIVEDPLSHGITDILEQAGMSIHPVLVDAMGLSTALLPSNLTPSLVFTTPSHQFPLGSVLPISRRIELIRYARNKGAYIVEDDYDSEFRFEGAPIQSMQSLDPDHVIYVGTFSKILCPALRMGYLILPRHLTSKISSVKYTEDIHSPVLEQLTLSKFIKEGHLDAHIRKAKKYYHAKSKLLIHALRQKFGTEVSILGHSAGIHLVASFTDITFDTDLLSRLEKNGLRLPTPEAHAMVKGRHMHEIMIGYGNLTDEAIIEGIHILYETAKKQQKK